MGCMDWIDLALLHIVNILCSSARYQVLTSCVAEDSGLLSCDTCHWPSNS